MTAIATLETGTGTLCVPGQKFITFCIRFTPKDQFGNPEVQILTTTSIGFGYMPIQFPVQRTSAGQIGAEDLVMQCFQNFIRWASRVDLKEHQMSRFLTFGELEPGARIVAQQHCLTSHYMIGYTTIEPVDPQSWFLMIDDVPKIHLSWRNLSSLQLREVNTEHRYALLSVLGEIQAQLEANLRGYELGSYFDSVRRNLSS